MRLVVVSALLVLLLALVAPGAAGERGPATPDEILALYERLLPGMPLAEVAAMAGRPGLLTSSEPVTSWTVWSPPRTGSPTAVLRATFQDGRLARLEYEAFGDAYRRLAKGSDAGMELGEAELRRLWERTRGMDECREALEAFHRLLLRAQDRLTREEQEAWVAALELRRRVDSRLGR